MAVAIRGQSLYLLPWNSDRAASAR